MKMNSSLCSLGQQGHSKFASGDVHLPPWALGRWVARSQGEGVREERHGSCARAGKHARQSGVRHHSLRLRLRVEEPHACGMCVQVAVDSAGGSDMHAQKAGVPSTSSRGVSCMCDAHADRGGCRAGAGVHAREEGGRHHPSRPQAGQPHGVWFDVPCAVHAQPPA